MDIKPIETAYDGYRFRSRLEAKWAVYFNLLHIQYDYEPEGYVLDDNECYLPDFYLPKLRSYFEVKPIYISNREESNAKRKLSRLATATDTFGMICFGDPLDNVIEIFIPYMGTWETVEFVKDVYVGNEEDCGFVIHKLFKSGAVVGERHSRAKYDCKTLKGEQLRYVVAFNEVDSYDGIPYYEQEMARKARFEHGECG